MRADKEQLRKCKKTYVTSPNKNYEKQMKNIIVIIDRTLVK